MGLKFWRAIPLTWDDSTWTKFSNFHPKSKYQTYTLFDIRVNSNNNFPTDKMNVMLTQQMGANHELLEVYSKPQTGPLPRLLGSYLSRLSAHNLSKIIELILLFQHTSTVECRSCVVYTQYNNLYQFGLLSQAYQPISPSILIHFRWKLYQISC